MRYSAQSAGTGSQAGGRVSCAARLIAFGRRAVQAAAGVWRAVRAAQVQAAGVDAAQAGVDAAQAGVDAAQAGGPVRECPPVSADELDAAAGVIARRRAAGELVRGSSVLNNAFGHFSDEVHAAGDARAAAVRAAQVATTSARAAARA